MQIMTMMIPKMRMMMLTRIMITKYDNDDDDDDKAEMNNDCIVLYLGIYNAPLSAIPNQRRKRWFVISCDSLLSSIFENRDRKRRDTVRSKAEIKNKRG